MPPRKEMRGKIKSLLHPPWSGGLEPNPQNKEATEGSPPTRSERAAIEEVICKEVFLFYSRA